MTDRARFVIRSAILFWLAFLTTAAVAQIPTPTNRAGLYNQTNAIVTSAVPSNITGYSLRTLLLNGWASVLTSADAIPGGLQIGTPFGGNEGPGTINVAGGYYVNGVAVAPPIPVVYGTGVVSALANNIGSAGSPIVFNGAAGTPSSINLSNASGTCRNWRRRSRQQPQPRSTAVQGRLD